VRLLVDHNFDERVVNALLSRTGSTEVIRARELGMERATDEQLLERAAADGLVVLTHDVRTLVPAAHRRVRQGEPMAGVLFVPASLDVGRAIRAVEMVLHDFTNDSLANRVVYVARS